MEPATFNFTSSAKTHNFTITAMTDNVVEEEQSVALSVTTDAVNVAIQSNMPTVIIQDRTSEYMSCVEHLICACTRIKSRRCVQVKPCHYPALPSSTLSLSSPPPCLPFSSSLLTLLPPLPPLPSSPLSSPIPLLSLTLCVRYVSCPYRST